MFKKAIFTTIIVTLFASLAACSAVSVNGIGATLLSSGQTQLTGTSSQTLKSKLAIGTLKLEGTNLALTVDQANTLLPLWKAVKSLSNNSNTTPAEMSALYDQIEETLTDEQLKAIQNVTWTQADLSALKQKYAAQAVQSSQTSTKSSSTSSTAQSGGGPMPGDMGPGGDPLMGAIGTGTTSTSSTSQTARTTVKSTTSSSEALNVELAGNVVTMLNQVVSA